MEYMEIKKRTDDAFRAAVNHLRAVKKIKVQKLADAAGCSKRYIQGILSEKEKKSPGGDIARQISKAFGYTYEDMLFLGQHIIDHGTTDGWKKPHYASLNASLSSPGISGHMALDDQVRVTDELKNEMMSPSRKVPIISWVQAGAWTEVVDNFQPGDAEEWVTVFHNVGDNAFALQVVGDSMSPEFQPGETIIVDPAVQPETGKFVIAKIDNGGTGENGEATFKQFVRDGSHVYLKPLNDKYPLIDMTGKEFRIVGCVVEKRKKY